MNTLMSLINVLIATISIGGVTRIIMCCIHMMASSDGEQETYKRRIKHLLLFIVLANTILILANVFLKYYGRSI